MQSLPDASALQDSYVLHAYTPALQNLASNEFHPIFFALHNSEQIHFASRLFGDNSEKVTPVPIPNTVVKLLSADNTWRATAREHRTSPELRKSPSIDGDFLYRENSVEKNLIAEVLFLW